MSAPASSIIPSLPLTSGSAIPVLGLGTWKSKEGEVYTAVKSAIQAGYRLIDCAFAYGNEAEVGRGIRDAIAAGYVRSRTELFVVSKLWNTFHSRAKVMEGFKISLAELGLEYLDLYLIHWPMGYLEGGEKFPKDANGKFIFSDINYLESWQGMEDLVKAELCRSIGLSNFSTQQIERVLNNSTIRPAALQVECHPYLTQEPLLEFCRKNSIVMMGYSPLGSPDRPWAKPGDPALLNDPKLAAIAERYGKSAAQVLIRFQIQRGVVVIPKSVTAERIKSNCDVFDFTLSSDDMSEIASFNRDHRFCALEWVSEHPLHPFYANN